MSNIQFDKSTYIGNPESFPYKRTSHKRSNILSILSWNIESRKTRVCNKFSDPDFLSNIIGHDIIALQETKGPIKLANYKAFNSTRPDSISGGVSILFKHEIKENKFFKENKFIILNTIYLYNNNTCICNQYKIYSRDWDMKVGVGIPP